MEASRGNSSLPDVECVRSAGERGGSDLDHGRSRDPNCKHCCGDKFHGFSSSSCSFYSSWLALATLKDAEKLRRIIVASMKGFAIGAGLKGGLPRFSILARLRRRKVLTPERMKRITVNSDAIVVALKETLRYGLFLGTFAGTYVSVHEMVATWGGHCRTARWRALLAGVVAGPSMLLTGFETQHISLAIYILMRAAVLASRCGIKSKRKSEICHHLSTLAISSIIIVHGNQSCGEHILSFLIQSYQRALPVYLPVYLIPAIIVHRQGLLKRPYTILAKVLLGTARSSMFLSAYCTSAWMWTCLIVRGLKHCNIPLMAMGTFPTGLALAIEKKSRRIEISLYCLSRAIESFFTCMGDGGNMKKLKNLKRADVLIFSASTAIIMHCYAREREVFHSKYLNVLDWVFGVPPPPFDASLVRRWWFGFDYGK